MLTNDQGEKITGHRNQYLNKELNKRAEIDYMIDKGVINYNREVQARDILSQRRKFE